MKHGGLSYYDINQSAQLDMFLQLNHVLSEMMRSRQEEDLQEPAVEANGTQSGSDDDSEAKSESSSAASGSDTDSEDNST